MLAIFQVPSSPKWLEAIVLDGAEHFHHHRVLLDGVRWKEHCKYDLGDYKYRYANT